MNDLQYLERCANMVETLNDIKGTNNKKDELKNYEDIKDLIKLIWDPETKTGITPTGIKKYLEKDPDYKNKGSDYGLIELFNNLTNRVITGHEAKASVCVFMDKYLSYKELIVNIFSKNLRMRIGAKTISEVFPNIFVIFKVLLAHDFDENKEKDIKKYDRQAKLHKNLEPMAFLSEKKDGARVIAHISSGNVKFLSRTNNEYTSLGKLKKEILKLISNMDNIPEEFFLDGEVVTYDDNGENFKLTISHIRKQNVDMPDPHYFIFDFLTKEEFYDTKENKAIYSERYNRLSNLLDSKKITNIKHLHLLEQKPMNFGDDSVLDMMKRESKRNGWEGVMLRFNHKWEPKRTNNLLKIKLFKSDEFKIVDYTVEEMPYPNKNGGEDMILSLKNIIINHKNNKVNVGSGFSKDERIELSKNPETLIGQVVTVKYQEEFQDPNTKKWSLRIPIFMALHGKKREV